MAENVDPDSNVFTLTDLEAYGEYLGVLQTLKIFEDWRNESSEANDPFFQRFVLKVLEHFNLDTVLAKELPEDPYFQKNLRERLAAELTCCHDAVAALLRARTQLFPKYLRALYREYPPARQKRH